MKIAYISGPYRAETTHQVVENIRYAEKIAIKYWKKGYAVICPHKNTALFDGVMPDHVWLDGDLEIIKRLRSDTDVLVLIKGWKKCEGAHMERHLAIKCKIQLIYD